MQRLLWKEFHEQIWLFLAALGTPLALLFYLRAFEHYGGRWPPEAIHLWPAYAVFAFWGATRLPHEREAGRLTLAVLPIRAWQVWVAKALPGVVGAIVCTYVAFQAGMRTAVPGPDYYGHYSEYLSFWVGAGEMASAYCVAFLASQFWSVGPSAVVGAVASTIGWPLYWDAVNRQGTVTPDVSWLWTAALLAVSACVMQSRAGGGSTRRAGLATLGAYTALVGLGVVLPALTKRDEPRVPSPFGEDRRVLLSRPAGLAAYAEMVYADERTDRPIGRRLLVFNLDGSGRREIARATGIVPLAWAGLPPHCGLLYLEWEIEGLNRKTTSFRGQQLSYTEGRKVRAPGPRMLLWDRRTGKSRFVESLPSEVVSQSYHLAAASEPGGGRVAVIRPAPHGPPGSRPNDLWIMDLATQRSRLLRPNTDVTNLTWAGGRIYYRDWPVGARSISPDGGRPRREPAIPEEETQ